LGTLASSSTNYTLALSATPVNFTITAKPVTVTPDSGQSKVYSGSAATDPVLTYSLSQAIAVTGALARAAGENVGPYAINLGTLASSSTNYTLALSATPVNFTITSKPVRRALDRGQSKVYSGSAATDPVLTYSLSQAIAVTGALARAAGENVGPY